MADGGMTNEKYQKLKARLNDPSSSVHPALRRQLQSMLSVMTLPQQHQDEQDRRYRNFGAHFETLPEDQKPTTMGGYRDVFAKFGMEVTNMSSQDAARKCSFNDFMDNIGPGRFGLMMMDTYETQHMEDAKPRCDYCKKEGATMRCKQCGEWYCARECQKADWPEHKRACKFIAGQRTYAARLDL